MSAEKQQFTGVLSKEDYEKFKAVAEKHGVAMIDMIRIWVRRAHKRMEKE